MKHRIILLLCTLASITIYSSDSENNQSTRTDQPKAPLQRNTVTKKQTFEPPVSRSNSTNTLSEAGDLGSDFTTPPSRTSSTESEFESEQPVQQTSKLQTLPYTTKTNQNQLLLTQQQKIRNLLFQVKYLIQKVEKQKRSHKWHPKPHESFCISELVNTVTQGSYHQVQVELQKINRQKHSELSLQLYKQNLKQTMQALQLWKHPISNKQQKLEAIQATINTFKDVPDLPQPTEQKITFYMFNLFDAITQGTIDTTHQQLHNLFHKSPHDTVETRLEKVYKVQQLLTKWSLPIPDKNAKLEKLQEAVNYLSPIISQRFGTKLASAQPIDYPLFDSRHFYNAIACGNSYGTHQELVYLKQNTTLNPKEKQQLLEHAYQQMSPTSTEYPVIYVYLKTAEQIIEEQKKIWNQKQEQQLTKKINKWGSVPKPQVVDESEWEVITPIESTNSTSFGPSDISSTTFRRMSMAASEVGDTLTEKARSLSLSARGAWNSLTTMLSSSKRS